LSGIGVLLFVAIDGVERMMIPWHASQRHDLAVTA
jgi:NitT/TauT family transport system permease protein